jgi:hypothetical protein
MFRLLQKNNKNSALVEKTWSIQDEIHLADFLCVRKNGRKVWAVTNNNGNLNQFNFVWDFNPFHETAIDEDRMNGLLGLCANVRDLEQFTMSVYSGADCTDRVDQLKDESAQSAPEVQLLYRSDIKRTQEIAEKRSRKTLKYQITATHTINPDEADINGVREKVLYKIRDFWGKYLEGAQQKDADLIETCASVFEAWEDLNTRLVPSLKNSTKPVSGDRIWAQQWRKFNGSLKDPGLPYYVFCDLDRQTVEVIGRNGAPLDISQRSPLSVPLTDQKWPDPTRDQLNLPARKEYATVLHFSDIPEGWDEPEEKYRFLWDSLLSVDGISDLEFHSQLTWASGKEAFRTLQAVTKQNLDVHNTAEQRGSIDKSAELVARAGGDALELLLTGDRPIYIGLSIVVYATSEEALKNSVRKIKARFDSPCDLYQEPNKAWKSWLQTTLYRMDAISTNVMVNGLVPHDTRHKPNLSAAIGLMPSTGIRNICEDGVEFISTNGSNSVLVGFEDEMGSPWMGAIYGGTGSGKSVVSSRFIRTAVARGWVSTLMDLPDGKGNGSYSYLVDYLGGIEIDTGKSKNNLLEMIDVKGLDPVTASERLADFQKAINRALTLLMIDTLDDTHGVPVTQVKGILPRAIAQFYRDEAINDRIQAALSSSPGQPAWDEWPTLHNFMDFLTDSRLNEDNDETVSSAIRFARGRLRYWLEGPLSQTIASPSDRDMRKHKLVLFSLRSLGSDEEAAVLGLIASQAAERRSLTAANSFYYVDECGVILKYPSLAVSVGNDFLTARKKGKRVLIAMQTPNSIDKCVARDDILQNCSYKLIGKIKPEAVDSFERILKMSPEDISKNVGISANSRERSTNWILVIDGNVTHAKYFADDIGLTAVLTNSGQVNLRNAYAAKYPDKFQALARAAADVRDRMISGKGFKDWETEEVIDPFKDDRIRY